ncbi:Ser/Thr protein phosphatase superfamily [Xylaria longipes]|nr:Ser/Thr protein phosphatase superfamily [Xylaria longipes]RYC62425.1 hypothetical protein CHU98_g3770 [Xylaria longipes]
MVCIQILSDLHLESPRAYDIFDIPPKAPYLALLGDIGYAVEHEAEYRGFLRRQLANFRVVFLVLGNHEPWHSSWDHTRARMRDFEATIREERKAAARDGDVDDERNGRATTTEETSALGEFILLDQTRYDLPLSGPESDGAGDAMVTILGCTLFSRVPPAQVDDISVYVQDFYKTTDWTVQDHTARFEEELAWLNNQVAALEALGGNRKIIALTHYSPSLDERTVDPRHRNSHIQAGFATDLTGEVCFQTPSIGLWVFGHTHFNCDFVHDERVRTKLLTNQRGYYFSQSNGFDVGKVVEI